MKKHFHYSVSVLFEFVLVIAAFYFGLATYDALPDLVASHWNYAGAVDGYMQKPWGVFLLPILMAGFFVLMQVVPIKRKKGDMTTVRSFHRFIVVFEFFLLYVFVLIVEWNLGAVFNFVQFLAPALAILFFAVGSMSRKMEPNFFIGIRNPWTLANEKVWKKVHAVGYYAFLVLAVFCLAGTLYPQYLILLLMVPLTVIIVGITLYSFIEYQRTLRE